jgi:hypothetical protein
MKLTILYDNEAWHKNLQSDWEFSCLIETHCTQNIREIKQRYPLKYIEGGAGKVIAI